MAQPSAFWRPLTRFFKTDYFDTTPEFWLNLQAHHDLEVERERIRHELAAITPRSAGGA